MLDSLSAGLEDLFLAAAFFSFSFSRRGIDSEREQSDFAHT
jgi:hypothetical protein